MVRGKSKCEGKYFPNSGHFQPRGLPKFVVAYLLTPHSGVLLQALVSPWVCVNHLHLRLSTLPGFPPTCLPQCQNNKPFICFKPGFHHCPPPICLLLTGSDSELLNEFAAGVLMENWHWCGYHLSCAAAFCLVWGFGHWLFFQWHSIHFKQAKESA